MNVFIPFKERFKQPLLDGTKTWTTRSHVCGKVGDTFEVFGATFVIDKVEWMQLGIVGAHWRDEGCDSLEDFIATWCQIHPEKGYNPDSVYCVHKFHREIKQWLGRCGKYGMNCRGRNFGNATFTGDS